MRQGFRVDAGTVDNKRIILLTHLNKHGQARVQLIYAYNCGIVTTMFLKLLIYGKIVFGICCISVDYQNPRIFDWENCILDPGAKNEQGQGKSHVRPKGNGVILATYGPLVG